MNSSSTEPSQLLTTDPNDFPCLLERLGTDHGENTASIVEKASLLIRCIATCLRFRGNMFTESLPSNGFVGHNIEIDIRGEAGRM
jgi:hypothetical protein